MEGQSLAHETRHVVDNRAVARQGTGDGQGRYALE